MMHWGSLDYRWRLRVILWQSEWRRLWYALQSAAGAMLLGLTFAIAYVLLWLVNGWLAGGR